MRKLRTAIVAGAAVIGLAGTAFAATRDMHEMNVDLPDGAVMKVEYAGKVAPKIQVVPVNAVQGPGAVLADPFMDAAFGDQLAGADFAGLDRVVAMMDVQSQAMMQQVAAMQRAAAASAPAMHRTSAGDAHASGARAPAASSWQYTVMTSSNGSNACTRTVEWSSNGTSARPRVTRTSAGDCDAARQDTGPVPAAARQPAKVVLPGTPA